MIWQIDFRKFGIMMLPSFLRKERAVALLSALTLPIARLSERRLSARQSDLYALSHTGQVCSLRAVLNDAFGYIRTNGFEIRDVQSAGSYIIVYQESESNLYRHVILSDENTPMLYAEKQITVMAHFAVMVPPAVWADECLMSRVRAIVERYRLVSRLPIYNEKTTI